MEEFKRVCLDFVDLYEEYTKDEHQRAYVKGFELGIKIMLNIVYNNENDE